MLTDGVVTLRRWEAADAGWYAEQSRDPQIQRFTSDPPDLTAERVAAAIEASAADPASEAFLVVDAVSGERLANLAARLHDDGSADLSYWVAAAARGRGVAARALRLLSDELLAGRVTECRLWTRPDNHASQAAARRAGYERDPGRDGARTVDGEVWPSVAFRRVS